MLKNRHTQQTSLCAGQKNGNPVTVLVHLILLVKMQTNPHKCDLHTISVYKQQNDIAPYLL